MNNQQLEIRRKRAVIGWYFYDWANSAFPTIITTFIFAPYFTSAVAKNKLLGTSQWGDAIAIAGLLIAILSPPLGAIADNEGRRKPWLAFFTLLAIAGSALLWFAKPGPQYVSWTLICVIVGTIGFEVSMVFYNSMLSGLAKPGYLGRLSGWSWGFGYFGGLISLIIALLFFVQGDVHWLNLDKQTAEQIRICGPLVAVWFALFAWPIFVLTPDRPSTGVGFYRSIRLGLRSLFKTLRSLKQYKNILTFLIARMLYIDGLNTIFAFGGIFAAGTFGMSYAEVIQFGISMNIAAGIGAAAFAWMDDYKGSKKTILTALAVMIVSGSGMLVVHSKLMFWILGMVLSLCVGPIQAASRSLMVRLAPKKMLTEMFGLYAFSGKATAFMAPWIVGFITYSMDSQRLGLSIVFLFLFLGSLLLWLVKEN